MHQDERQAAGSIRLRMPVAMAKYAAAVYRIYNNLFCNRLCIECRTRKKVSDNRLKVAIRKTASRDKISKPMRTATGRDNFGLDHEGF